MSSMSLRKLLSRAAAGAAVGTVCLTATAQGASIMYVQNGNVWAASASGEHVTSITTDGTPTFPTGDADALVGPYESASADDSGRIVALRAFRTAGRYDAHLVMLDGAGRRSTHYRIVTPNCAPPRDDWARAVRVNPAGTFAAFEAIGFSVGWVAV